MKTAGQKQLYAQAFSALLYPGGDSIDMKAELKQRKGISERFHLGVVWAAGKMKTETLKTFKQDRLIQ